MSTRRAVVSGEATAGGMGTSAEEPRSLRYFDLLLAFSATVAVSSNLLTLKIAQVGPITFAGVVIFFPITYILSDVVTEVYGFRRARRARFQRRGSRS